MKILLALCALKVLVAILVNTALKCPEASDLRAGQWAQNQVGDVIHDTVVAVPRVGGKLLPCRIVAEDIPLRIEFGHILEGQHVLQVRHTRANLRIAKEHWVEACCLEYLKLTGVKHLHFASMFPVAGALVNTQLKNALVL